MSQVAPVIAENLKQIEEKIDAACERAGRDRSTVRLIAVTKYAELDWVRALIDLGVTTLGESRPQQLVERAQQLDSNIEWHLIGHLQRNKIRRVLPHVSIIHSVDSLRLTQAIDRIAGELNLRSQILLEVNVSCEATKDGWKTDELVSSIFELNVCQNVDIKGLMTMAPRMDDEAKTRQLFGRLRELAGQLGEGNGNRLNLNELSMGMSGDFECAIAEGATMIRIGSALFNGLA